MRRVGIFLLAFIALVAMAGPVSAQPKVTITGFVDNVTSWSKNMSVVDTNVGKSSAQDREWYARTRVRPDITAEVGTTKFVLGLEIDFGWGQAANQDTTVCLAAACPAAAGTQQRGGQAGADLNTDMQGDIKIKWAYTEFDMPIMPVPTRFRLGAQNFAAHYKPGVLAHGDFAGVHMENQWNPMVKTNLTYVAIEEQSTGVRDNFQRGEDFALITSIEVTPFKGLDIRPIFAYANLVGPTSTATRQARGGIGVGAGNFPVAKVTQVAGIGPSCGGAAATATGCFSSSAVEDRYTVGVDARWRFGPFSLDPTVFYQFGNREQINSQAFGNFSNPAQISTLKRDAWFVDVRGGWQAGPLLLELAAIYTTGNKARDRIDLGNSSIKYYEPIDLDGGFYGGWAEIWALGIDYFNTIRSGNTATNHTNGIGYDKYGLIRFGTRVRYDLTPTFSVRAAANANWTAEPVDTQTTTLGANGLAPCTGAGFAAAIAAAGLGACSPNGTAQFIGTEVNVGFTWRFVPNVAFDMVYAHGWTGNALATNFVTSTSTAGTTVTASGRNPKDIDTIAARVRYSW
jgi:hypothetical protein